MDSGLKSLEELQLLTLTEKETRSLTQGRLSICRLVPITSLSLS